MATTRPRSTDSRPLYQRRQSVELRIDELERALHSARERHDEILSELEYADTMPAPPMPANDVVVELEVDWVGVL